MEQDGSELMDESVVSSNENSTQSKISPPITLLQEICSRNGLTPDYQLLSTEGSVHEPTFKIAVTVGDISAIASGQSKKKARHAAAREAIDKLRLKSHLNFDGINFECLAPAEEVSIKSPSATSLSESNPVGKLQEICMKMRVNPPTYETCNEKGLAHERVFILSCTIASLLLSTLGQGRSKKLAKRQAAENMLSQLESSGIYDKTSSSKKSESETDSLHIDADDNSNFVYTRQLTAELVGSMDCTVSDLWKDINMIETDNVNEDLFYELFQETISQIGLPKFSYITDTHCLLHVCNSDNDIVMSSFGYGKNTLCAMKDSVINAYKEIMVLMRPLTATNTELVVKSI